MIRLMQERHVAEKRGTLIAIFFASGFVLILAVVGGGALYHSHMQNLALTEQLHKVAEQHEALNSQGMEIAYWRNWR